MKFSEFLKKKGLAVADLTAKSAAELATLQTEFLDEITKAFEEASQNGASKEELKALSEAVKGLKLPDEKEYSILKGEHLDLMKKMAAIEEKGKAGAEKDSSIRGQIKSFIEANKDKFEAFKKGEQKSFSFEIDTKVAATMLVGTNTGTSAYLPGREVVAGFTEIARNRPFIEQYANTSGTSSPNIVWVNLTNKEGNAAFIAEGTLKPLIDWEFLTETSVAKKVAARTKVSTEMLDDIEFMAAAIENELRYEVDMAVDAALLTGTGLTVFPKGITAYAGGYVLTTIKTTTPNNFDAIRAAIAQIISLNFAPTHVFINPIDAANMDLIKDSTGRPISMEYRNNNTIYRITPIEANQIPVGSFLVADMSKFVVRNYKPFQVAYGWENDDFSKNLVSVIGERRLHTYASSNNTGAFVYATFAAVKTALTAI